MKKLTQMFIMAGTITMAICGVTATAHAESKAVSFSYSSNRAYYACSYFEGQGEKLLKKLGADSVSTRCNGGLPDQPFVAGTYYFRLPAATGAVETVSLRVNEACDFNEKLVKKLLTAFDVVSVSKKGGCFDASGTLRYTIQIRR